ncbi:DUF1800 domain-containing protein [Curvibacter sp. CHRR-16]|uniref:DUF1800 domain-containing protein n=1 Tax=Curvibacter sp. CHRR-16 TaxID=2835872 RepID=UPI001BD9DA29|nr:DUF1800 domain-containing protein [Curvibacter sp. CHRR-16]MBT0569167.1 DUF1800 domain-containing protein [Curvibacter sp. CHRR-16]
MRQAVTEESHAIASPLLPASNSESSRLGVPVAVPLVSSVALTACGGGGGGDGGGGSSSRTIISGNYTYATASTDREAARFLIQAQCFATTEDIAAVRARSYESWLDDQFNRSVGTKRWDWLNEHGYASPSNSTNYWQRTYQADWMMWAELMTCTDTLRKRIALALSEIFVVSVTDLDFNWRSHAIAHYWDQLVANAFGNYRQLMKDMTLNVAMGYYLNTRGNQKENAATGRLPDENFAREIMQLMTIGLVQLNQDGTVKTDSSGTALETYTQSDVSNLARVFTGYDIDQSQNAGGFTIPENGQKIISTYYTRLPMTLTASLHSTLAVEFLGTTIPAGTPGAQALEQALDALFNHANVGPFIGKQLIQRLVTSNPSPAYVSRVAARFNNNGSGVRGDMKAVITAILMDDEARSSAGLSDSSYGRLREPMLRFLQWGRTFGVTSGYGTWKIEDLSGDLGQSPLRSPSVFNFFRPGYVPPSTAMATAKQVAPEFQLVNEVSVARYLNFMAPVIQKGYFVNGPNYSNPASNETNGFDISTGYPNELALVTDADALLARVNLLMCAGQLSAVTVKLISDAIKGKAVTNASTAEEKKNRIAAAVLLVMASADYLIQK